MAEPEATPQTPEPGAPSGIPENWKDSLAEELRADPTIANVQTVEDLARMTISGQKMIGKDKIGLPGEGATPEEWGAVYDALGRPGDGTGYELKAPDGLPEQVTIDADLESGFRKMSHELGLLPAQAAGLFSWYLGVNGDQFTAMQGQVEAARDESEATLKREWGQAYDAKLDQANRAVREFGGTKLVELLESKGLASDPHMVRLMAGIGAKMGEDSPEKGSGRDSMALTPDAAKAAIAQLQTDTGFQKAYGDNQAPSHDAAVQRMKKLFQQAYSNDVISTVATTGP